GAHTGDISPLMLKDLGCTYVILGHSERRADHGETDELVRAKAEAAHKAGLKTVICIGETLAQRDDGKAVEVCRKQILGSVPADSNATDTVIAYEPVWAIGTGKVPTTADVEEVHAAVRKVLAQKLGKSVANKMRILYGGSVKPGNAKELLSLSDVDGALIGGASLKAEDFVAIAKNGTC
ncbi:MAG: triose-phosphate isomerase, partial [Alphaproteobacteria bacterium]|nr:triose-phosphate isomerase [Alphaproteobacteria bacterium]